MVTVLHDHELILPDQPRRLLDGQRQGLRNTPLLCPISIVHQGPHAKGKSRQEKKQQKGKLSLAKGGKPAFPYDQDQRRRSNDVKSVVPKEG